MARLYVMLGLPGSGKSTRAREIVQTSPRTIRVNRDDLRLMFFNDRLELRHESLITAVEHGVVLAARDKGYDVIVDDTNLRKDVWTPFARKNGMEVVIEDLRHVPVEVCIARGDTRGSRRASRHRKHGAARGLD